jgi:hypothetical protein
VLAIKRCSECWEPMSRAALMARLLLFVDSLSATKSRTPRRSHLLAAETSSAIQGISLAMTAPAIAFAADTNDHYRQLIGKSNREQ